MKFYKYSGSGNDFIFIDQLDGLKLKLSTQQIQKLCDRRFGVGADGVIFLDSSETHDFTLNIRNADGSLAEMCGNASRCALDFLSRFKNINKKKITFETVNGSYEGELKNNGVRIYMSELYDLGKFALDDLCNGRSLYLNTGVPHSVFECHNLDDIDLLKLGRIIRNDERFGLEGTNVDFFEVVDPEGQRIKLRIYERGVEGETLCCGTGVMAVAISCHEFYGWVDDIYVETPGGLIVAGVDQSNKEQYFEGPVQFIFQGDYLFE